MDIYKRHDPSPLSGDSLGIGGQQVGEVFQPLMGEGRGEKSLVPPGHSHG